MKFDQMTMAYARRALQKAVDSHLYTPNIDLIDVGFPEHGQVLHEDDLAIRFHVHKKLDGVALETAVAKNYTQPIPEQIDGFKTDITEGMYRPNWYSMWTSWKRPAVAISNQRAQALNPMEGGISISDEYHNAYGTLGGVVRDRMTGEYMILSNWHVLIGDWHYRPNRRIYQPGRLDGGTAVNTVARLRRHAMSIGLDAAIASLTGDRAIINNQFGIGPVTGVAQPTLGMVVTKSGRRTNVTKGRVTGLFGKSTINYSGLNRQINNVVTIHQYLPGTEVSAAGDSGSWWLDAETRQVVGLHFAGSNTPERGLAMNMSVVLKALNIEVVI